MILECGHPVVCVDPESIYHECGWCSALSRARSAEERLGMMIEEAANKAVILGAGAHDLSNIGPIGLLLVGASAKVTINAGEPVRWIKLDNGSIETMLQAKIAESDSMDARPCKGG